MMRKNFGPQSWLFPTPVLIIGTYDENGTPDAMTAGWGGIYDVNTVMVSIDHEHKTADNIKKSGAFTVSFASVTTLAACDYVGIVSANDVPDKFAKAGFHATKSAFVNAPLIDELPLCVECELIKFNEDGICIGKIVNICADACILDEHGKVDLKKFDPIICDSSSLTYLRVGEPVGKAFSDGKEKLKHN